MTLALSSTARVVPFRRYDGPTDAELVERARARDRWAEEELFRRHFSAVAATVMRLLGDRDEAEDVVQDTFASAITELSRLREAPAFRSWLLQIAVSKVHRRFRRNRLLRTLGLMSTNSDAGLADLASKAASPDQYAELLLLDRCLARVSASDRIAWTLRHVDGMKLVDVASACQCSLATAKRRIASTDRIVRAHVRLDEPTDDAWEEDADV